MITCERMMLNINIIYAHLNLVVGRFTSMKATYIKVPDASAVAPAATKPVATSESTYLLHVKEKETRRG